MKTKVFWLEGYYYEENTQGQSKVPVLGDLPIVGSAFKSKKFNQKEERPTVPDYTPYRQSDVTERAPS